MALTIWALSLFELIPTTTMDHDFVGGLYCCYDRLMTNSNAAPILGDYRIHYTYMFYIYTQHTKHVYIYIRVCI